MPPPEWPPPRILVSAPPYPGRRPNNNKPALPSRLPSRPLRQSRNLPHKHSPGRFRPNSNRASLSQSPCSHAFRRLLKNSITPRPEPKLG